MLVYWFLLLDREHKRDVDLIWNELRRPCEIATILKDWESHWSHFISCETLVGDDWVIVGWKSRPLHRCTVESNVKSFDHERSAVASAERHRPIQLNSRNLATGISRTNKTTTKQFFLRRNGGQSTVGSNPWSIDSVRHRRYFVSDQDSDNSWDWMDSLSWWWTIDHRWGRSWPRRVRMSEQGVNA